MLLAHPARFERVAFAFGRSNQLSYACLLVTQCLHGLFAGIIP